MTEQTIEQLRDELEQARAELVQRDRKHKNNAKMIEIRGRELDKTRVELAQARDEPKDLQGANRALGQQVARVRRNRDFWYNTCLAAEAERDQVRSEAQEQSDEVQRDWLSPCQKAGLEALAETLRRQLTDARRVARLWFRRAHEPMVEVEITGKEMVEALQDERAQRQVAETSERVTRKMLARQCDMARAAETEAMKAKRELAETRAELAAVDGAAISKLRLRLQDTEIALQAERKLRRGGSRKRNDSI